MAVVPWLALAVAYAWSVLSLARMSRSRDPWASPGSPSSSEGPRIDLVDPHSEQHAGTPGMSRSNVASLRQ